MWTGAWWRTSCGPSGGPTRSLRTEGARGINIRAQLRAEDRHRDGWVEVRTPGERLRDAHRSPTGTRPAPSCVCALCFKAFRLSVYKFKRPQSPTRDPTPDTANKRADHRLVQWWLHAGRLVLSRSGPLATPPRPLPLPLWAHMRWFSESGSTASYVSLSQLLKNILPRFEKFCWKIF